MEIYNHIQTRLILLVGVGKGTPKNIIANFLYAFAKEKKMNISIDIPENPELSIVFGAVLFGLGNYIIRNRKVQFTTLSKWYSY